MSLQLQANTNTTESFKPEGRDRLQLDAHPDSRVFIELRTDAAFRTVIGRPRTEHKPAIIGLLAFAALLRDIWDAAKNDDPYARWWLLKVETSIARAETIIQSELTSVRQILSASAPLGVDRTRGYPPRRVDLMFACPYAYTGARLVKQLDTLITELDTGAQIGVLSKSATTQTRLRSERAIRHTFSSAQGFWNFGISNELVQCCDPKAIDAAAKMGAIPADVLSGERWPALLDRRAVTPPQGSRGDDA